MRVAWGTFGDILLTPERGAKLASSRLGSTDSRLRIANPCRVYLQHRPHRNTPSTPRSVRRSERGTRRVCYTRAFRTSDGRSRDCGRAARGHGPSRHVSRHGGATPVFRSLRPDHTHRGRQPTAPRRSWTRPARATAASRFFRSDQLSRNVQQGILPGELSSDATTRRPVTQRSLAVATGSR